MTEVKEIIDKVYETIDSLYEDGKLRPYMRVYVDKDIIPEMFKRLLTTKTDTIKIIPEEWQWEVKL